MTPLSEIIAAAPIEKSVCELFDVTPDVLHSKRGPQHAAEARFAYIAKVHEVTRYSKPTLAKKLHCLCGTVYHAIDRANELREIDPRFERLYCRISCQ